MTKAMEEARSAWRTLRSRPSLTAFITIILGLGIGANCSLFAVVNSLLLRPLPFQHVDELIEIQRPPQVFALDELRQARSLAGVAAFHPRGFTIAGADGLRNFFGFRVSANLFDVLGVKAALGRTFQAGEETSPVVILGYDYWRAISGEPSIIGQTLTIADELRTVVGVLPSDFVLPVRDGKVFVPYRMTEGRTIARVRPGISLANAEGEVKAILKQAAQTAGTSTRTARTGVEPLSQALRPNAEMIVMLQVAVIFVLLITCTNAGNILLVRTNARRREFAIRTALGAERKTLLRQLMLENGIIATLGGILGLLFAHWSLAFVEKQLPGGLVRMMRGTDALSIDHRVLFFAIGISALTVLIFGAAPALTAMKVDVIAALRSTESAGGSRKRYMEVLAVIEIALAVILLMGAGVMGKSLLLLENRHLGFSTDVLRTSVELPPSQHPTPEKRLTAIQTIVDRLRSLPGVTHVGIVGPQLYPFAGPRIGGQEFLIRGRSDRDAPLAEVYVASPDYFRTLQIPLLRGRTFTAADNATTLPVAIVSSSVAKRYWPDSDPIGAVIRLNSADPTSPWTTVVGIAGDIKNPVGLDFQAHAYRPLAQSNVGGATIMIRSSGNPMDLAASVRREIGAILPNIPEVSTVSLESAVQDYISPQRFSTSVLGIFAFIGLALSAAGAYGVMRQWVSGRIMEIVLRMALGALPRSVLQLVMRRCSVAILLGIVIGVVGTLSLQRAIASQVIGVNPADPIVLGIVVSVIGLTSLAAAFLPALWASRIDPIVALKYE